MHSHSMTAAATAPGIFLVGQPNVGKSVLFHRLTGTYVQVSNYPGTTVEIARAATRLLGGTEMVDTPGVLTLPVRIDDERVTLKALLEENCRVLIQVGDAKNLQRSLAATAMLAELGLPMMLVLNMLDEARARGIDLDVAELERALGIPVVATVATQGDGVNELARRLDEARACRALLRYDAQLEADISTISQRIEAATAHPRLAARGLAILFLGNDPQVQAWLAAHAPAAELAALQDLRGEMDSRHVGQLAQRLAAERAQAAQTLARRALRQQAQAAPLLSQRIGRWVVHPLWGWPVLAAVLYLMYEFVGVFGATTLVGLLEEDLFEGVLNPLAKGWVEAVAPWPWLADLIVGDYGLWTMGMTYALALILPIVTTFFIAFGALEDSGYLPRLSVIANRLFAVIGLNGRAPCCRWCWGWAASPWPP
jgi:ferrous iron transport protein B